MARQRGPIVVYGATGYTGRLIAAELAGAGADFVLAGRNEAKLDALAEKVGAGARTQVGDPVIRAAIETGTHYIDTSGEQRWMDRVFRRHGADAERAEIAAISAM